jgi:DNA-directed RNA polymerase subunit RPC12/RpoP
MRKNSEDKQILPSKIKENEKGYKCCHCGKLVLFLKDIGTKHRNHCPFCLWSQHLDDKKPGDRKSNCKACMEPIGLTFKQEGKDKYDKIKQGELMLIHKCLACSKISINRIASDDNPKTILKILKKSKKLNFIEKKQLQGQGILILTDKDKGKILVQLFGSPLS